MKNRVDVVGVVVPCVVVGVTAVPHVVAVVVVVGVGEPGLPRVFVVLRACTGMGVLLLVSVLWGLCQMDGIRVGSDVCRDTCGTYERGSSWCCTGSTASCRPMVGRCLRALTLLGV